MTKCLLKCLTFCSCLFPLLARIAESRNVLCPNRRNYSYKYHSPCQTDRRMFGNKNSFNCQSNLPFCVDDEKEIRPKTYRGLPQAFHGMRNAKLGNHLITFLNPKESENEFCFSLLNRSISPLSDHGASTLEGSTAGSLSRLTN